MGSRTFTRFVCENCGAETILEGAYFALSSPIPDLKGWATITLDIRDDGGRTRVPSPPVLLCSSCTQRVVSALKLQPGGSTATCHADGCVCKADL